MYFAVGWFSVVRDDKILYNDDVERDDPGAALSPPSSIGTRNIDIICLALNESKS